ncbi:MAG: trypsin-like peptidase domain-containing protein [Cyanobacteria bacterium SBLK]|nr:trypsin-like peptidase domain-containing protein [Cyanobacteria bacterium SBLK]
MNQALEFAVVQVCKATTNQPIGAGFAIAPQYLMTCAHVAAYALGERTTQKSQVGRKIEVSFPFLEYTQRIETEIVVWLPVKSKEELQDIAILKIDKLPDGAKPIALMPSYSLNLKDREFKAYGFPEEKDRDGKSRGGSKDGTWTYGRVRDRIARGRIQLQGKDGLGLESGFSGAPIWDDGLQCAIGMAVKKFPERPESKVAFMTSTDVLLKAWQQQPQLGRSSSVNYRIPELAILLESYYRDCHDEIYRAYQNCWPSPRIESSQLPKSALNAVLALEHESYLDLFVEYLKCHLRASRNSQEKSQLLSQLEQWQKHFGVTIQAERSPKVAKNPCLLVKVTEERASFSVRAWLIENVETYNPAEVSGCLPLDTRNVEGKFNNFPELLNAFYNESMAFCQCEIKKIHISLPYKIMDFDLQAIDRQPIPDEPFEKTFGADCELTLRFSERLKSLADLERFKSSKNLEGRCFYNAIAKWQRLRSQLNEPLDRVFLSSDSQSPREINGKAAKDEVLAVHLSKAIAPSNFVSIATALYYAGIPLALWIRSPAQELNCDALEQMWQQIWEKMRGKDCECPIWEKIYGKDRKSILTQELPKKLKDLRHDAWETQDEKHIGNHLSLLWDDPNLAPPDRLLAMP